ncbi:energy transducer TonB [Pedobacter cryoconitis]|uniref:Protein TonB n=1 Tax=Pedobacter cryoconitis TaxID=188932 RepID=A0A7X0IZE4_9SPHI|nr:energy transducer TonB [Pedobacter cryoconitis]MBB6498261.1 protein TonB [Pedobacter cryoconitis]
MLNISSNLYKSEWTNLVFKNRNQAYGAYLLRAQSSSITWKAFYLTVPVFVLLFAGPMLYRHLHPDDDLKNFATEIPVTVAPPLVDNKIHELKQEPVKPVQQQEKVKTYKLTSRIEVVDKPETDEMPQLKDLENAVAGQVTQTGVSAQAAAIPVSTVSGNGNGDTPAVDNNVYDGAGVERYPEFEGGMGAWTRFLQRNLRYPDQAQERGVQGKVYLSFVVEKDGSISSVTLIKGIGAGCDEEAIRVLKKSPRWKPGQQNQQSVRVRYTMPFSFQLGQ